MGIDELNVALLIGTAIVLVAVVAVRLSSGAGLPSLIVYLGIGAALGGSGLITFNDLPTAQTLGIAALVLILAEGGLTARWSTIRPVMPLALSLSTVGVGVSVLVVALVAHTFFDMRWQLALLCGAVLSSTDAAAVFSTLRRVPLQPRLAGTLEAESGMNDAPVIILVMLLSSPEPSGDLLTAAALIGYELVVGAAVGVAVGWLGVQVLRHAALPASGLYPIGVMTFAVMAYATAAVAHSSGFLAVYLAALVLGNSDVPHRGVTRGFAEAVAWIAQIGLFVMLGLLVSPVTGAFERLLPALGIGVALLLLARPLSVLVASAPFRTPLRDQGFLAWAGLRGAVPIVFAIFPTVANVDGSRRLLDVVFVLVVVFTLIQGPTLPWVAKRLGVLDDAEPRDLSVEAAPLDRVATDLLQIRIPVSSRLHGVEVAELRLPPGAVVALIVRADQPLAPTATTALRHGDELLVVVPRKARREVEARLHAISLHGRLAGWLSRSADAPD